MRVAFSAGILLLLAGCAATPPGKTQLADAGGSAKECRTIKTTGSNMPQRICAKASDWADYDKVGAQSVDNYDNGRRGGGGFDQTSETARSP